jgi:hypothetical protein
MSHKNVIDHPELKRAKAFALYLARCHARNNGLPLLGGDQAVRLLVHAKCVRKSTSEY